MDKLLVLYTMKGCVHCETMKTQLKEEGIDYYDRDIDEYSDEYDMFVEITENDYVPAFMIVDTKSESAELFAPDIDFDGLESALEIIKEKL